MQLLTQKFTLKTKKNILLTQNFVFHINKSLWSLKNSFFTSKICIFHSKNRLLHQKISSLIQKFVFSTKKKYHCSLNKSFSTPKNPILHTNDVISAISLTSSSLPWQFHRVSLWISLIPMKIFLFQINSLNGAITWIHRQNTREYIPFDKHQIKAVNIWLKSQTKRHRRKHWL